MAKFLSTLPIFRVGLPGSSGSTAGQAPANAPPVTTVIATDKALVQEAATLQPLEWWGSLILGAFLLFFAFLFLRLVFPPLFGLSVPADEMGNNLFIRGLNAISVLAIPLLLSVIPLFAILRQVKVYEEFIGGAKEGFEVAIKIIPYLVAMLVAIGMFRAAGGIDLVSRVLTPVLNFLHFPLPADLLPMVLVRPLSGSGSLGFFTELVKNFGPDSLVAQMAGTIYGSTETTFYVLAVYFGSVAITRTRHAVLAGLTADCVGVVAAVFICRLLFT